jgi:hypothetical protein
MKSTKRRDTIPGTPSSIRATRLSEVRGKTIQTSFEAPDEAKQAPEPEAAKAADDEDERVTLPVPAAAPAAERRPDPRREED